MADENPDDYFSVDVFHKYANTLKNEKESVDENSIDKDKIEDELDKEDGKYFAYNIFLHASQRNLDMTGFERRWKEMSPSGGTTR